MLVLCMSHQAIERALAKPVEAGGFGVGDRCIRKYIGMVYAEWRRRRAEDPSDERERSKQALEQCYQEAVKRGEIRNAIRAQEVRARLLGLNVDRLEVSGPNGGPIPVAALDLSRLTPEELEALEKITAKIAAARPDAIRLAGALTTSATDAAAPDADPAAGHRGGEGGDPGGKGQA